MLGEQTKDDDNFNIVEPKEGKNIASDSLQNPSDPDATYRFKYGSNIDKLREEMETKEYIKLISQRAGVEGIPSVFRREQGTKS